MSDNEYTEYLEHVIDYLEHEVQKMKISAFEDREIAIRTLQHAQQDTVNAEGLERVIKAIRKADDPEISSLTRYPHPATS
jgi:hypothetical protein